MNRTIATAVALIALCTTARTEETDLKRVHQGMAVVLAYDLICHKLPDPVLRVLKRAYSHMTEDEQFELRLAALTKKYQLEQNDAERHKFCDEVEPTLDALGEP